MVKALVVYFNLAPAISTGLDALVSLKSSLIISDTHLDPLCAFLIDHGLLDVLQLVHEACN